jgi:hypothetical protein
MMIINPSVFFINPLVTAAKPFAASAVASVPAPRKGAAWAATSIFKKNRPASGLRIQAGCGIKLDAM